MVDGLVDVIVGVERLAAVDVDQLDADDVHAAVVLLQQCRHRLGAIVAGLAGRWDAERMWSTDGSRTATTRLAREAHCSTRSVADDLRRARALRELPEIRRAATAGEISLDHVDLLVRADRPNVRTTFQAHTPMLLGLCRELLFTDVVTALDYWRHLADADSVEVDGHLAERDAKVFVSSGFDGTVHLTGHLDPVRGTIIDSELHRLERLQLVADRKGGIVRTLTQRRAAALAEMATRSSATGRRAKRARPLITVVMGEHAFQRTCELANGTVLAPGQVVPLLEHADIETILFDADYRPISSSPSRRFRGALRRAIEVRDRRCHHPSGCDVYADRCDVDHIVPAARGGPTAWWNGRLRCSTHNRYPAWAGRARPGPLEPEAPD